MPMYRLKFHLQQFANGWTYEFFTTGNSAREVVDRFSTSDVISRLSEPHAQGTQIVRVSASRVRVGNEPIFERENYSRDVMESPNPDLHTVPRDSPDVVQTAVVLRFYGAGGVQRNLYLRGLPDVDLSGTDGEKGPLSVQVQIQIQRWIDFVVQSNLQIRSQIPDSEPLYRWWRVNYFRSETGSDGVNTEVVTREQTDFAVGDRVELRLPRECVSEGYRGVFEVLGVNPPPTARTIVIGARYRSNSPFLNLPNTQVRRVGFAFTRITSGQWVKVSKRDTGRAASSRGRKKGRSCRN